MNKTYRSVWNESTGTWVAVQENAPASGKKSSTRGSRVTVAVVGVGSALAASGAFAQTAVGNGGIELCSSNSSTAGAAYGFKTSTTNLTCAGNSTNPAFAFSLNNAADASGTGGNGFSASTARVTGYANGLLELKGTGNISMLNTVTMNGNKITSLAAGTVSNTSTDGVNGSQLFGLASSTANTLGGGATVNPNGSISAPTYTVAGATYNNVGSALDAISATSGANSVQYDDATHDSVTLGGAGASSPVALHNVANGVVAEGSTDAVNGGQLFDVSQNVTNVNNDLTKVHNTLTTAGWGAQAPSADPTAYQMGGFITDANGNVSNPAVLYVPNTVGTANSQIVLDAGQGSSKYFVNGNRQDGYLPAGTIISNVANGVQDTDAANVGQVYDIVAASGGGSGNGGGLGPMLMASNPMLGASSGSGTETTGLNKYYLYSTYYQQVMGLANSAGQAGPTDAATANALGSMAIGSSSLVETAANGGAAIGLQTHVTANDAVALGAGSVANQANTVSVGSDGTDSRQVWDPTANGGNGAYVTVQSQANTRRIVNMAAGQADTDAVNVSQLKGVTKALGGGAGVNADGSIAAPSYNVAGGTYSDVGSALTAVDAAAAANVSDAVKYDSSAHDSVTFGNAGTPVALHNVAAGDVSISSSDAVNGAQLYTTNQNVSNLAGSVTNIAGDITNINGQLADTVKYDSSAHDSVTFGNAGTPVALHNVAAGDVSISSSDAVNGAQLYTTNQNVSNLAGDVTNIAGDVTNINGQLADAVKYDSSLHDSLTLGGVGSTVAVALHNVAAGDLRISSTDAVNGGQLYTTNQNVSNLAGSVTNIAGDITNINGQLADAVKYDSSAHDSVTFGNAGTPVALHNVAAGDVSISSSDAVNGAQLYTTNQNVSNLAGSVTNIAGDVTNINGQLADAVKYDSSLHDSLTLGGVGSTVAVALHNVAAGDVSISSTDAVNGGQLYTTNQNVSNLAGAVTNIAGDITNINGQLADAVSYDSSAHDSVTFGNAGTPVALHNVAAGDVSISSSDAVNGAQLYTTNQNVSNLAGDVTNIAGDVTNINGQLADAVKYDSSLHDSLTLGGVGSTVAVALHNVAAGDLSISSTDAVNGGQLYTTNQNVSNLAGAVTNIAGDITNINGQLADAVSYDSSAHDSVTFGNAGVAVALHNVAAGDLSISSTDAVNGGQLYTTNQNVSNLAGAVTDIAGDITNINGQLADAVAYDSSVHDSVTLGGVGSTVPVALHNVASGLTNNDAVNVGQLASAGFSFDAAGNVVNQAVTYDANSVDAGSPHITLDPGTGNSKYFVNGNRQLGNLPAGTVISNVASGVQDTDAANVGQVYDLINQVGGGGNHPMLMSSALLGASAGSGVNTAGLNSFYQYSTYYQQVVGLANSSGQAGPADAATAGGLGSAAIGSSALVDSSASGGVALGVQTHVKANDAVAIGAGSVADQADTVSVGSAGTDSRQVWDSTANGGNGAYVMVQSQANTRRIVNMAAGQADTDAVNVSQLKGVTSALGAGAGVNADGSIAAPSYVVDGATYNNVGSALSAVAASGGSGSPNAVTYDDSTKTSLTLGGAGTTGTVGVHNVAAGDLSGSSSDAVNGAQLYTTNQNVSNLAGSVTNLAGDITNIDGQLADAVKYDSSAHDSVTFGNAGKPVALHNVAQGAVSLSSNDAVNGSQLFGLASSAATALGGSSTVMPNGAISAPSYVLGGLTYNDVGSALDAVMETAQSGSLDGVVYDSSAHDSVTFGNAGKPVALHNVAQGAVSLSSNDAVNGSQLFGLASSAATALGGSSAVLPNGAISAPSYVLGGLTYNDVGSALDAVMTTAQSGSLDGVVYDSSAHDSVTFGNAGKPVALHNVAQGAVSLSSNDAVNGSQLFGLASSAATALGGSSTVMPNGAISAPSYVLGGLTYNDVGSALDAVMTTAQSGSLDGVVYDSSAHDSLTLGGVKSTVAVGLHNVAAGDVSASSSDAVTGAQLYTTNQNVSNLAGSVTNIAGDVTNINGQLADAVKYDSSAHDSLTLGGVGATVPVALHNVANATSNNDAVNLAQLTAAGLNVDTAGNVTNAFVAYDNTSKSSITLGGGAGGTVITNVKAGSVSASSMDAVNGGQLYSLQQQIDAGGLGLVAQDTTTGTITVGSNTNGNLVDFTGTSGARTLTGVAAGSVSASSVDAVNGAQLYNSAQSTASALGGGSTVNPDGTVTAPSYSIGGSTYDNVGGALTNLDGRVTNIENTVTNIAGTVANAVQYDSSAHDQITLGGTDATSQVKLTNLQDADLTATSTDAVTGEQLYATNQQVADLGQAIQNINVNGSQYMSTNTTNGPASATGTNSIAAGGGATASGANSTAMGDKASATGNNSVALGANSVADQDNTVSVGSAGNERRITNVADGVNATDAVNMGQLQSGMNSLQSGMNSLQRNAYGGIAAATALTMIPDVDQGKTLAVGVGTANFKGYQAAALGASARITQNLKVKLGAGYASGSGTTVGGGMAYQW